MPVLPSDYLTSWYILTKGDDPNVRYMFQSWSEEEDQPATPETLIQGDIGTRVMNIGGRSVAHRVSSPVLIEDTPEDQDFGRIRSIFGLLADSFAVVQQPILTEPLPTFLMSDGTIRISPENVTVEMGVVCDLPETGERGAFVPQLNPGEERFYRTANWMDTSLSFHTDLDGSAFRIQKADISFKVSIDRKYFPNQSPRPLFQVQGYQVSGSVEILMKPSQFDTFRYLLMPMQQQGLLVANKNTAGTSSNQISIGIGNEDNLEMLAFGKAYVGNKLTRRMGPKGSTIVGLSFQCFGNSSTPLVYTNLNP
jgi:hypothetical protein